MAKTDFPMSPAEGSSSIAAHGYDKTTRTMRIQFTNGGTYEYPDFPEEKYAAFSGASSAGSYHARKIKPLHAGRKVG